MQTRLDYPRTHNVEYLPGKWMYVMQLGWKIVDFDQPDEEDSPSKAANRDRECVCVRLHECVTRVRL